MSTNLFDEFYELGDPITRAAFRAGFVGSDDCGAQFSRAERRPAAIVRVPWMWVARRHPTSCGPVARTR